MEDPRFPECSLVLPVVVGIPAGILAGVGYVVSEYVPEEDANAAGDGDNVP